ncbi:MAG: chemotaxis protein CheD [Clostridiaceae bacterium]
MENLIKVGIADYKITSNPHGLVTLGLGSCVGIAIYDTLTKIGGLSHIMLPDSTAFGSEAKQEKFADLAIIMMVREMNHGRLVNKNLVAKIAGGARMFDYKDKKQTVEIGQRNVEAVERVLLKLGIPILGRHTGGTIGRTMVVDLSDFKVDIKAANKSLIIL